MPTRLLTMMALAVVGAGLAASAVALGPGAPTPITPGVEVEGTESTESTQGIEGTEGLDEDPVGPRGDYGLPLAGQRTVVHPFRPPATSWGAGHRGVDLSAAVGEPVLAPAEGVVSFAGTVVDRGVLTVVHPDGLRSSFEPVTARVGAGTRVARGDVIGEVEPVGGHCSPETCLHWGLRRGEVYLDPLRHVGGRGPVRLLPDRGAGE